MSSRGSGQPCWLKRPRRNTTGRAARGGGIPEPARLRSQEGGMAACGCWAGKRRACGGGFPAAHTPDSPNYTVSAQRAARARAPADLFSPRSEGARLPKLRSEVNAGDVYREGKPTPGEEALARLRVPALSAHGGCEAGFPGVTTCVSIQQRLPELGELVCLPGGGGC